MRRLLLVAAAVLLVAGGWLWIAEPFASSASGEASWRTARVDRGTITAAVNATGTINPISTVIVGSQLSGQVIEILADYNDRVRAGQVLARLNADQIRARHDAARADLAQATALAQVQEAQLEKNRSDVLRARATVADAEAQARRAEIQLADAEQTLARTTELQRRAIATDVALQTARTNVQSFQAARDSSRAQIRSAEAQIASLEADRRVIEAQLASARASIQQREAVIRQIEVDIRNSEIKSPVEGVIVQRSVELGQTVAASLQAPTLFLVAEDLRTMRIFANVDETDVGRVQPGQPVTFTVNAFPGRTFEGRVEQVRLGSQTVQNVVIYTAVITVENPGNVLMPGMTANLRILTENRVDVLRVPNAALRWRPPEVTAAPGRPAAGNPFAPPTFGPGMGGGPPGGAPPQAGGQAGQAQRQMQEFLEALRAELRLTADQSREVDAILADMRNEARGAMQAGGSGAQRREAFGRLREAAMARIEAVLTDAQKPAFAELRGRFGGSAGAVGRVYVPGPEGEPVAVQVRTGVSDGSVTELVAAGRLAVGAEVIVGGSPRPPASATRSFLSRFGF